MKKIIILSILLMNINFSFASESLRRCMLLPIIDSVQGAISFKVFEKLEEYLKDSSWCYYRSNSKIIDIIQNYKKNLSVYLQNKEVIKQISEKSRSGSIIRINLVGQIKGMDILMDIVGDNGEDVYFRKKITVKNSEINIIVRQIQNWLTEYQKLLPYDARIMGVLGDQFTVDSGKEFGIFAGDAIEVVRPISKKIHPLLKEVVGWNTEKVATAKVFHSTKKQAHGKASKYYSRSKLKIGDWIIINKDQSKRIEDVKSPDQYEDMKAYQFGKLGTVGIFFQLGTGGTTIANDGVVAKKMGGTLLGASIETELWITRDFWMGLDIDKRFGSFKKKEGTFNTKTNTVSLGVIKFMGGYRYLPLNHFYGPRVDAFLGYASYDYDLDIQTSDGITGASFKGLMLGAKGSLPVHRLIRAFLQLDFMVGSTFTEEATVYGEDDSSTNYHFEIGGNYEASPQMKIESAMSFSSNKAKFKPSLKEYSFKDTNFKLGVVFTY